MHRIGEPQPRRGRARCPIHNGDSPTSLSLSEEKGVYHCHVFHSSGDKLDFVQRTMGINFVGALSMLGLKAGKHPKPDPAIVRQRAAIRIIRDWCRGEDRISGKAKINDAIHQISKLWDEVEHSGASVAWEWILRGSLHGARIRQADARVDAIGSKSDQTALQSACDSWVTAWQEGIKAWKKTNFPLYRKAPFD